MSSTVSSPKESGNCDAHISPQVSPHAETSPQSSPNASVGNCSQPNSTVCAVSSSIVPETDPSETGTGNQQHNMCNSGDGDSTVPESDVSTIPPGQGSPAHPPLTSDCSTNAPACLSPALDNSDHTPDLFSSFDLDLPNSTLTPNRYIPTSQIPLFSSVDSTEEDTA